METSLRQRLENEAKENPWLSKGLLVALCLAIGVVGGILTAGIHPVAGFAIILGVLVALAMLSNTQVGIITFISIAYLLPFAVIPLSIGGVRLTFIDGTLTVLLLVWILRLLSRPDERFVNSVLDPFIILFMGLAIVSFVIGVNSVSAEVFRFFLKTINSLLFFFSVTNCVRRRPQLEQVVKAIMLVAFLESAVALVLYVLPAMTTVQILSSLRVLNYPSGIGLLRPIAGTDIMRAIGTSIDPNVLGGMLTLAIPLALTQLFSEEPLFKRKHVMVMVVAMALGLILTFSRGSWIGVTAAVLFIGTFKYRKMWIALIFFVLILYFLPQGEVVFERVQSGVSFEDRAAAMRLGEYKDALRLIAQYPWFGVGFGAAPTIDLYIAASSIYLLIAEEMGLIGLSAFLLIILVLYAWALKKRPLITDLRLQSLQLGAMAGLAGALTAGIFDHQFFNLYFPHTVALFWLFAGLVVVTTRMGISKQSS